MNRPLAITALVFALAAIAADASAQSTAPAATQHKDAAKPAATAPAAKPAQAAAKAQVFDLNTATREQLMTLPSMTGTYADAIIKGRPYKAAHELVSRKILPEAAYQRFASQVTVEKKKS